MIQQSISKFEKLVERKGLEPFLLACKANVLANYH